MNASRPDNGWILCPSKSFPGKFYYFNVINGDTVWTLNEAEIHSLKNPKIKKIDKPHSYPEPNSPPEVKTPLKSHDVHQYEYNKDINSYHSGMSNNTCPRNMNVYPTRNISVTTPCSSNFFNKSSNAVGQSSSVFAQSNNAITQPTNVIPQSTFLQRAPVFGQTAFAKAVQPNLHIPMFIGSNQKSQDVIVKTSDMPLSQRFANYNNQNSTFNENNQLKETPNEYIAFAQSHSNKHVNADQSIIDISRYSIIKTNEHSKTPMLICKPIFNFPSRTEQNKICNLTDKSPISTSKVSVNRNNFRQKITFDDVPEFTSKQNLKINYSPKEIQKGLPIFTKNSYVEPNPLQLRSSQTNIYAPSISQRNAFASKSPHKNILLHANVSKSLNTNRSINETFLTNSFAQNVNISQEPKKLSANIYHQMAVDNGTVNQSHKAEIPSQNQMNLTAEINRNDFENEQGYANLKDESIIYQERVKNVTSNENTSHEDLEKNDLRRMLMAKKRRAVDFGITERATSGKKIKTTREKNTNPVQRKKVTFNLKPEIQCNPGTNIEDSAYNNPENLTTAETVNIKQTQTEFEKEDVWYVVVDTAVLLEELQFLDEYVRSDPKCKLLIPFTVLSNTKALARDECVPRRHLTLARHLLRRLATPVSHVVVQPMDPDGDIAMSTEESIINCCIEVMLQNASVVLITNDEDLQSQARNLNINCFGVQQIKDANTKKTKVHFDIEKVKISVPNISENLVSDREVPNHSLKRKPIDITVCFNTKSSEEMSLRSRDPTSSRSPYFENNTEDSKIRKTLRCSNLEEKKPIATQKDIAGKSRQLKVSAGPENQKVNKTSKKDLTFYPNKVLEKCTDSESGTEDETVPFYFQNEATNIDKSVTSISKLGNNKLKMQEPERDISNLNFNRNTPRKRSIFEIDNDQEQSKKSLPRGSNFEIDGMDKLEYQPETNCSVFDNTLRRNSAQNALLTKIPKGSIYGVSCTPNTIPINPSFRANFNPHDHTIKIGQYENIQVQLKNSFLDNEKSPEMTSDLDNETQEREVQMLETVGTETRTSLFDTIKYKNTQIQSNPSVSETGKGETNETVTSSSVFDMKKYESRECQSIMPAFETAKYQNRETRMTSSIFELEEKNHEKNKEVVLEDYLKRFCLKSKLMEERVEEKKDELVCSFVQVMEYCLSNVLENSQSSPNSMSPPYTLFEALQCIVKVYDSHTKIASTVHSLCTFFYDYNSNVKKQIRSKDLMKTFGCGLWLIGYLKKLTQNTDGLVEADNILKTILQNLEDPRQNKEMQCVKTPAFCRSDLPCKDSEKKKNFVKDRSEVVNYLKRHFSSWAEYDENLENAKSKSPWGRHNGAKIVRTVGKDLNFLKIHNNKSLILNNNNNVCFTQEIKDQEQLRSNNNQEANTMSQYNVEDDNNNKTEIKIIAGEDKSNNTVPNTNKPCPKNREMKNSKIKLKRVINNKLKSQEHHYKSVNNHNLNDKTKTEPKVIRLFSNLNFTKEQIMNKTVTDKSGLDLDYTTHGHSFGTDDNTGQKIVRNVKLIQEYEDKFTKEMMKSIVNVHDLDSAMSIDNDIKSENTDNNCISMTLDNENAFFDTNVNSYVISRPNESSISINDIKDNNFNENRHLMSDEGLKFTLDNCLTINDAHANHAKINDSPENEPYSTNDTLINDNKLISHYMSSHTNIVGDEPREEPFTLYKCSSGSHHVTFSSGNNSYSTNDNSYVSYDKTHVSRNNKSHVTNNNVTNEQHSVANYNNYGINDNSNVSNDKSFIDNYEKHVPNTKKYSTNDDSYMCYDMPNVSKDKNNVINDANYCTSEKSVTDNKSSSVNDEKSLSYDKTHVCYVSDDNTKVQKGDSGFEAYRLVKTFFQEVRESFKLVHTFIQETIKEIRKETILEYKKLYLHSKAKAMHAKLISISNRFKCIIQRESTDGKSLKMILAGASSLACKDQRIATYRHTVQKCLEQANILEKALEEIITVTIGGSDSY